MVAAADRRVSVPFFKNLRKIMLHDAHCGVKQLDAENQTKKKQTSSCRGENQIIIYLLERTHA